MSLLGGGGREQSAEAAERLAVSGALNHATCLFRRAHLSLFGPPPHRRLESLLTLDSFDGGREGECVLTRATADMIQDGIEHDVADACNAGRASHHF